MREDASESLPVGVNGSRSPWSWVADNEGNGGRSGDGRGGGGSLLASACMVPAASSGRTISATHHRAESMNELLLYVFLRIVPGKFVLIQPAAPVDKGNTEHFSAARRGRLCARASFQVVIALANFLNDDVREYGVYFYILLDIVWVGVSDRSRSRSRSLRTWCGSL